MKTLVTQSSDISECSTAFMFRVEKDGRIWPAFLIRYKGKIKAYLNVCAHAGLRLNGDKNQLFDRDGKLLRCTSHGAAYEPESGQCVRGPAQGYALISLQVSEKDGNVYYEDSEYELVEQENKK